MQSWFSKILREKKWMIMLWALVVIIVFVKHNLIGTIMNNYYIFKYTFYHAINGLSQYGRYPAEYDDKNHYGPFFSFLFAPFAIMPDWFGHLLWVATLVFGLLWAIRRLPLAEWQKNAILLICVNDLLTAGFNVQFSIAIAALVVLTYVFIHDEKEFWAPLPILIGTFVKLYGVVGFAFFFLVKNKPKFILGCVVWTIVLFVAPMIISSPEYIINMYSEWYRYLVIKNSENISLTSYQDISIMGFVRRLLGDPLIPNTPFLIGGVILFALPYLRISQYKHKAYQLLLLASTLMFPIIFSSASESSTYVIVFVGIAIWFVIQPRPFAWHVWLLLALAIFFGSLNTTDVYPKAFRTFLRLYSIKSVPSFLIWLTIIYEMLRADFSRYTVGKETPETSLPQETARV
jgi:hypothetical protein